MKLKTPRLTGVKSSRLSQSPWWRAPSTYAAVVVLLALFLRLYGITWQLPWRLHPDEPPHVEEALTIAATLDFQPAYFNQPPLLRSVLGVQFLILDRLGLMAGEVADARDLGDTEYDVPSPVLTRAYAIGRINSAIFGTITVLLVLLSVRPLLGNTAAILSALVLGLSLAHVRETHFATTTSLALCLSTLALYFSVGFAVKGNVWRLLAAVASVVLATWTRDLMLFSFAYPTAALIARNFEPRSVRWWATAAGLVALCGVAMLVAYATLLPYHMEALQQGLVVFYKVSETGELRAPQFWVAGVYAQMIAQSLGYPLLVLAFVGSGVMLAREPRAAILFGSCFALTLLGLMIHAKPWLRFGLPLEIFLSIAAGGLLARVYSAVARKSASPLLALGLILSPFVLPFINAGYFGWLSSQEDTRVLARNWIQSNLPVGTLVYAPGFTLPNVRQDLASGTPNKVAHIWSDDITTVITGQGCGEVLALNTFRQDPASDVAAIEAARREITREGQLLAEFSAGFGNTFLDHGIDDEFGPYWNLWAWSRPGPKVELYQVTPPCTQQAPRNPPSELMSVTEENGEVIIWAEADPRVTGDSARSLVRTNELPSEITASAVGTFVGHDSPTHQAVTFEQYGRQRLGLYRLTKEKPPQLIMLDDDVVTGCQCVSHSGLGSADVDSDGIDELLTLRYELGIQYLDVFSLNSSVPTLMHRSLVEPRNGVPAAAIALVPSDLVGPTRIAFLFEVGSQAWIDMWPLSTRPHGYLRSNDPPVTFTFPTGNRNVSNSLAVADFDGDGRNELALPTADREEVNIFRLPTPERNRPGVVTHYQKRFIGDHSEVMFTGPAPMDFAAELREPTLLRIDEEGRNLQVSGIVLDQSSPFPGPPVQRQSIGSLGQRDVVGVTSGQFISPTEQPALMAMFAEGRAVTVELYRKNSDGTFESGGIVLDRWRATDVDAPLGTSLAAADIDGDGIDELISGRKVGRTQDEYELHFHRIRLDPTPELEYLGRSQDAVPTGATFGAVTRVRRSSSEGDQIALAYLVGNRAFVDTLDVRPDPKLNLVRTQAWRRLDEEQIVGMAAGELQSGRAQRVYLAIRSALNRQIETASLGENRTVGAIDTIPWPDLKNSRDMITSLE